MHSITIPAITKNHRDCFWVLIKLQEWVRGVVFTCGEARLFRVFSYGTVCIQLFGARCEVDLYLSPNASNPYKIDAFRRWRCALHLEE